MTLNEELERQYFSIREFVGLMGGNQKDVVVAVLEDDDLAARIHELDLRPNFYYTKNDKLDYEGQIDF